MLIAVDIGVEEEGGVEAVNEAVVDGTGGPIFVEVLRRLRD